MREKDLQLSPILQHFVILLLTIFALKYHPPFNTQSFNQSWDTTIQLFIAIASIIIPSLFVILELVNKYFSSFSKIFFNRYKSIYFMTGGILFFLVFSPIFITNVEIIFGLLFSLGLYLLFSFINLSKYFNAQNIIILWSNSFNQKVVKKISDNILTGKNDWAKDKRIKKYVLPMIRIIDKSIEEKDTEVYEEAVMQLMAPFVNLQGKRGLKNTIREEPNEETISQNLVFGYITKNYSLVEATIIINRITNKLIYYLERSGGKLIALPEKNFGTLYSQALLSYIYFLAKIKKEKKIEINIKQIIVTFSNLYFEETGHRNMIVFLKQDLLECLIYSSALFEPNSEEFMEGVRQVEKIYFYFSKNARFNQKGFKNKVLEIASKTQISPYLWSVVKKDPNLERGLLVLRKKLERNLSQNGQNTS